MVQIKTPLPGHCYYAIVTKDIKLAFELTLRKGEIYLEEAKKNLKMIPPDLEMKPFLEFLFLTVSHYNQY